MSRRGTDAPIGFHSFTDCIIIPHSSENLEKGVGYILSQREICIAHAKFKKKYT